MTNALVPVSSTVPRRRSPPIRIDGCRLGKKGTGGGATVKQGCGPQDTAGVRVGMPVARSGIPRGGGTVHHHELVDAALEAVGEVL